MGLDHQLLLHLRERQLGLRGIVPLLAWFSSYLTDRSFRVSFSLCRGLCLVLSPTISVLGPRLFIFHAADLAEVTEQQIVNLHSYADDSQLYVMDTASTTFRWQQIVCR